MQHNLDDIGKLVLRLALHLGARIGAPLIAINVLFAFALAHTGDLTSLTQTGGWALELQAMFLATALALVLMGPGGSASTSDDPRVWRGPFPFVPAAGP